MCEKKLEGEIHDQIIDSIIAVFKKYSGHPLNFHGVYEVKSDKKDTRVTLILGNFPVEWQYDEIKKIWRAVD